MDADAASGTLAIEEMAQTIQDVRVIARHVDLMRLLLPPASASYVAAIISVPPDLLWDAILLIYFFLPFICRISHVLLCNVTQRVSFWFVVTDPSKNHTLPADEIQRAIRMNRNRINNVFFLNDQTLEFLKIPSTLAPPTDPSVPIWIIIFGVMFCIIIVATTLLVLSGIRRRRRKNKGSSEVDDTEDKFENMATIANSIACDSLDMKGGLVNDVFMTEDERLTPL
ncbi:collectrin [Fukomys damarensis]|uniref:collectrin n=1 Tax=Fukomys damarensis TaxID=885580 RepID=UPI0008FF35B3|nr:collectrin [Fukomys damarensis]